MNGRIYISPTEFVELTPQRAQRSLGQEIATRGRSLDFSAMGLYLPNPDPILKKQGKDLSIYKELRSDAQVRAEIIKRKAGALGRQWEIVAGESPEHVKDAVDVAFRRLDLHKVIGELLNATLYGYQPLEVMWQPVGSLVMPSAIIGKPPEWFVFSADNELRFRTKDSGPEGEELPARKFLLAQYDASYENPYGEPALSGCFWPVTFKRGGLKFWLMFTEKYGMPFITGRYRPGTSSREIDNLLDMLENMIQDAVAAIPDDSSVEIHEAAGKAASAEIYERLLDFCNAEISKSIVGQTLTTEVGAVGSYAAAKTHGDVLNDIVDGDARLAENTLNELIRWIVDINFGANVPAPTFSLYEPEDVDQEQAERDSTLSAPMERSGLRFSREYYKKTYGLNDEDLEDALPNPSSMFPNFSETPPETLAEMKQEQAAVDDLAEGADNSTLLQEQAEALLKPVQKLIEEASSYEEVMTALAETYPKMNSTQLEERLARAMFVAEVYGRVNAQGADNEDNT